MSYSMLEYLIHNKPDNLVSVREKSSIRGFRLFLDCLYAAETSSAASSSERRPFDSFAQRETNSSKRDGNLSSSRIVSLRFRDCKVRITKLRYTYPTEETIED